MFPADADAMMLALPCLASVQEQVPTATLLWVQRPGNRRVSLDSLPADADDARRAVRVIRPITGWTQLWVQRSGNGEVSLTRFPADAGDASPWCAGSVQYQVPTAALLWVQENGTWESQFDRFPAVFDDAGSAVRGLRFLSIAVL